MIFLIKGRACRKRKKFLNMAYSEEIDSYTSIVYSLFYRAVLTGKRFLSWNFDCHTLWFLRLQIYFQQNEDFYDLSDDLFPSTNSLIHLYDKNKLWHTHEATLTFLKNYKFIIHFWFIVGRLYGLFCSGFNALSIENVGHWVFFQKNGIGSSNERCPFDVEKVLFFEIKDPIFITLYRGRYAVNNETKHQPIDHHDHVNKTISFSCIR